jgi:hypothetical protein
MAGKADVARHGRGQVSDSELYQPMLSASLSWPDAPIAHLTSVVIVKNGE